MGCGRHKIPLPIHKRQTAREAIDPLAMSSGPSHFVVMATGQIACQIEVTARDDSLSTLDDSALWLLCAAWPWDG